MKSPGKMIPYLISMLGKKSDTVAYPVQAARVPDHFRGMLRFHGDRCKGCRLCERVCPAGAIRIQAAGEKKFTAAMSLDKCIFCGQCVDSCVSKALENTTDFELATADRGLLKVDME